ncbi:M23 family metallopeptidase [Entomospira culicis]|nr:M23 family metallopeptidase [Entomospira culicis]WDI37672.1 M23 family metallopeptidase [Entomospira culicis]
MGFSLWSSEHVVEAGQTLYSIARLYNTSVATLQELNQLSDPTQIRVGMILKIPSQEESSVVATSQGYHTVQAGDTYYNISQRYNLSVEELLKINQRTADTVLKIGEELRIRPPSNTASTPQTPPPTSSPEAPQNTTPRPPEQVVAQPNTQTTSLQWPIKGTISRYTGRQEGVTIASQRASSVLSVASGTVIYLGPHRELGTIVLVEKSGGYVYIYGGLDAVFVIKGQEISVGTPLGMITENTGKITFSVFKDANPIDPAQAPRS